MAKKTWIGGATAVAQVSSATVTGYDAATTYTITVTGEDGSTKTIDVAGTTDADGTAAALRSAWNASTHRLCTGITAAGSGAIVQLTADTAGTPFYVASSVAGGTGTFGAFSTGTANAGPYDYGTAANWLEGAIPAANDDVLIQGAVNITYGLIQSSVELDDFKIDSYTGQIGSSGSPLVIDMADADTIEISASGQVWLSLGNAGCSPRIVRTANAPAGQFGLYLTGTALATLTVESGSVKLMNTSNVTVLNVRTGATVYAEVGATITTAHNSGTLTMQTNATTINQLAGVVTTQGSMTATTINVEGGLADLRSTGTVGTLNADGGVVDLTKNSQSKTVTTANVRGGELRYDPNVVTISTLASVGSVVVRRAA